MSANSNLLHRLSMSFTIMTTLITRTNAQGMVNNQTQSLPPIAYTFKLIPPPAGIPNNVTIDARFLYFALSSPSRDTCIDFNEHGDVAYVERFLRPSPTPILYGTSGGTYEIGLYTEKRTIVKVGDMIDNRKVMVIGQVHINSSGQVSYVLNLASPRNGSPDWSDKDMEEVLCQDGKIIARSKDVRHEQFTEPKYNQYFTMDKKVYEFTLKFNSWFGTAGAIAYLEPPYNQNIPMYALSGLGMSSSYLYGIMNSSGQVLVALPLYDRRAILFLATPISHQKQKDVPTPIDMPFSNVLTQAFRDDAKIASPQPPLPSHL